MPKRVYRSSRRIRLADAGPDGRLRLDAAARYAQDVASDDVEDAGIDDGDSVWVVRRTTLDVLVPFRQDSRVELSTWSDGMGAHWAARRTSIAGDAGGRIELNTAWVYASRLSMRPARVPPTYPEIYGLSDTPRLSATRLTLAAEPPRDVSHRPWPLRASDVDVLGHANNAVHWEAVEDEFARCERPVSTLSALLEYRSALDLGATVELCALHSDHGFRLWLVSDSACAAAAEVALKG